MRTEIIPYKKTSGFETGEKKILGINISRSLLLLPVAFLLGRVMFPSGIMPLGLALFVAASFTDVNKLLLALFTLSGMVCGGAKEQIYITAASMLITSAIIPILKKTKKTGMFAVSAAAAGSILVPGMLFVYLQGFLVYDILKEIFDSVLVFSFVFIFKNPVSLISEGRKIKAYSSEEITGAVILAILTLSGFGDLNIIGFSLRNIISILIIMLLSFKCGPGIGASAGVTVGITAGLSGNFNPLIFGTYAFCGLLSGTFRRLGKVGACLGFVIGNAMLTIYLTGSSEILVHLKEITAAAAIFLLIPASLLDAFTGRFETTADIELDKPGYSKRIKELTVDRLTRFSNAFRELSKTFTEISETRVIAGKQDISVLFDQVADRVCRDCSLCLHCWERNFYNTYQVMFKIVERLDEKGRLDQTDIPEYFIERCERIYDFVMSVNSVYEIFKVDLVWKNKVGESRGLISQQLEGLSKAVSNLADEIDTDVRFRSEIEDALLIELNKAGIKVKEAIVLENKWNKLEVNLFHKSCGGKRCCTNKIEEVVSKVIGKRVVKQSTDCYSKPGLNSCSLKLVEEEIYKVTTGVARVAKDSSPISGDNYTFMNAGDGKFVLGLSDGMGSGQKAANESRASINLLEQFIEAGFDKDTTVKLINSILVLRGNDDSFATMDISVVDLYDGCVEFLKVGAAPAFIKKNGSVEVIRSVSLPAGILNNIEVELVNKKMESGEFLIMTTDGVVDSFSKDGEDGVKTMQKFIDEISTVNPQEIADHILKKARSNYGEIPLDDMTVLVAKTWRKVG